MNRMLVVGEDAPCCALGEQLVQTVLPTWRLAGPSINTNGITKLVPSLFRYAEVARHVQPVLCIADTDGGCPSKLLASWRPRNAPDGLVLRLAVNEAESWLLADRQAFAAAFEVPSNRVPRHADDIPDPKSLVLSLVAKSRRRVFRDEMVSRTNPCKPGTGYNLHVCAFVREHWSALRARHASDSLDRALKRLAELG